MKKILIFITRLVSCTAVIAAETAQPQWQPAQSLSTTPTTALPPAPAPAPAPVTVAQPAVTSPSSTGVP
ncbi:conjugal transfer protein TraN, partial [Salmonella enterica]|nr:conjugal transfer protein TraN [Salmonella enterica]